MDVVELLQLFEGMWIGDVSSRSPHKFHLSHSFMLLFKVFDIRATSHIFSRLITGFHKCPSTASFFLDFSRDFCARNESENIQMVQFRADMMKAINSVLQQMTSMLDRKEDIPHLHVDVLMAACNSIRFNIHSGVQQKGLLQTIAENLDSLTTAISLQEDDDDVQRFRILRGILDITKSELEPS